MYLIVRLQKVKATLNDVIFMKWHSFLDIYYHVWFVATGRERTIRRRSWVWHRPGCWCSEEKAESATISGEFNRCVFFIILPPVVTMTSVQLMSHGEVIDVQSAIFPAIKQSFVLLA